MGEARHTDGLQAKDLDRAATFLVRMLPALIGGATFEDAARAVLKRDEELMKIATDDSEKGALIRAHLADKCFDALNAKLFAERQARNAKEAAIKDYLTTELAKAGVEA